MAAPETPPHRALVVCPLLPFPPTSGGRKRTLRLLETMERAGAVPHVLTAEEPPAEYANTLRARGWIVEIAPYAQGRRDRLAQHLRRRPSPYLRSAATRIRAYTAAPPAFVQLEHTMSAYYHGLIAGVPSVLSLHNLDSEMLASRARGRQPGSLEWFRAWNRALATQTQERRILPAVDRTLCVSEHDATVVRAKGGRPLLVPNGVDSALFDVPPAGMGELVLFFGHLGYAPNREGLRRFLVEGWPRVRSERPRARLAVAGAGLEEAERRRLAASPGVEALGLVDDLLPVLAAAAVVVVPLWEGGGTRLKVLESMAAGRPVAGTPLGVERIGFEAGRHGLVAGDPHALAGAVAALLADPARAGEMGAAARRHAEDFRWPRVTAELERLYRQYVAAAPART